jgi:3-deoxy-D-manno-octulosonic-acid transferase
VRLLTPLYAGASGLAAPALRWHLRSRARRGREDPARLAEREGFGAARPEGPLLWVHAASVGESLSALPLLSALRAKAPALAFLVTTGTVTSAELLPRRLPPSLAERVLHRYAPLDLPAWVARFLDGWRPDAAVFVESELWPNTLAACRARGVPMFLANARFSGRAARRWARFAPGVLREMLEGFAGVWPQAEADAVRLAAAGAGNPRALGNLKWSADPLPAEPAALAALAEGIGGRPVFLAASTHPGEEEMVLAAHRALLPAFPDLLTIIAPRHADRGAAVLALAAAAGLSHARRSLGAAPPPGSGIYVADTMGELGLLYRLARVAFVGGSLVPHGGQNPLEPARLGCPMLLGPHHWNFADVVAPLLAAGAARLVPNAAQLPLLVGEVLRDPAGMGAAGRRSAAESGSVAEQMANALLESLPPDVRSHFRSGPPAEA